MWYNPLTFPFGLVVRRPRIRYLLWTLCEYLCMISPPRCAGCAVFVVRGNWYGPGGLNCALGSDTSCSWLQFRKPKNDKGCVWSCDLSTRKQNTSTNKYEAKIHHSWSSAKQLQKMWEIFRYLWCLKSLLCMFWKQRCYSPETLSNFLLPFIAFLISVPCVLPGSKRNFHPHIWQCTAPGSS